MKTLSPFMRFMARVLETPPRSIATGLQPPRRHRMLLLAATFAAMALSAPQAWAKSAEDYFHGGASRYIAGKIQEASVEVEEGLRHFPGDARLGALAEQLNKMKDKQKNPQGGSGNDDKKKDPGGDKNDPNKKDDDKGNDKNPDEKKPDEKKNDDKKNQDKNKDGDSPDKNPKDDPRDQGSPPRGMPPPGQMSEEDATRLLNSFADDEKKEQRARQKLLRKRLDTEQDW